jgi:hypothetical protein
MSDDTKTENEQRSKSVFERIRREAEKRELEEATREATRKERLREFAAEGKR